jgi:hypothetical protein
MFDSKGRTAFDSSSLVAKEKTDFSLTADLTPDENRDLLFDVDRSLEIPIDDFNENWWPLVSNIWTQ